jgi:hypothetical protein
MRYNCRECKAEHDTVESRLRCKCGASLDESMRLAEKTWMEEQRDLQADRVRNFGGYVVTDSRKVSDEFRCSK